MSPRLPAHLEVGALIRLARARGGMATVLAKGEADAGVVLLVLTTRGRNGHLFERMPSLDGSRRFQRTKVQDEENPLEFSEYLNRRKNQDPDIWILEVDIDEPDGFLSEFSA